MNSNTRRNYWAFTVIFIFQIFLQTPIAFAQQAKKIVGRITDKTTGEVLIGVSVLEVGTSNGIATNIDGAYTIHVASSNSVLRFSYLGYEEKQIKVGSESVIDVMMEESSTALEEVTVVAFGVQKKTDMVGSITSIKPAELRVPASNLTTSLAGQAAGVISYQRSGEPGDDNADFFIRGVTSFGTGKVDPLILIDGMELSITELARLRPDDIESFSIFKDATSTALYGARGANGVIYVTTKKGKEGRPVVSFRAEGSMSTNTRDVEFADPVTYMKMYNEARLARDPFATPKYSAEKIDMTERGSSSIIFPAVDWKETMFKDHTLNHRYNLNVSGGGKVASYYVAGSFAQDNGMLKMEKMNNFNNNIDLKSYTLRANVNINLTKSSELIVRLNGNFDNYNGPILTGKETYNQIVKSSPVDFVPFYPRTGQYEHVTHVMFGGLREDGYLNPYAEMVKGYREYDRSLMMAQMEFKQDLSFLVDGLRFRTMLNTNRTSRYDILRSYQPYFYHMDSYDKYTGDYEISMINESTGKEWLSFGIDDEARQQTSVFYWENALDFSRTFAKKHNVSALLVSIMRSESNAKAKSLQLSLPSRNIGISGRTTYSYDSRYFAEFNFGYNGSERFSKDKRFGFFPSLGVAWSVSNESFWTNIEPVINNLRVRYTYGIVGNDAIGSSDERFFYLSNVNMSDSDKSFTFGKEFTSKKSGITVTQYPNAAITWEQAKKQNIALELGILEKWNIMADFFAERRTDILMSRKSLPSTMGLTAEVRANLGEASAKGMDISVDFSHSFRPGVWLQLRGNFTYATNKYEVFEEPDYSQTPWLSRVGHPISQQWGYIAERLFVDDSDVANSPPQDFGTVANVAGDIKYKDINGDGIISALDRVPIGYPTVPEIIYGFGFSFGYKQWDVSAFFQGSARSSFFVGGKVGKQTVDNPANIEPFVGGKQPLKAIADSYYSLENPDIYAFYPRLSAENQSNNMQLSTWWLRDGSFLRLKQTEIGYTLPEKLSSKANIQTLRFYLSGTNLFLLSKFDLWDVEMGGNGLGYPLQKVFNLGVNITF